MDGPLDITQFCWRVRVLRPDWLAVDVFCVPGLEETLAKALTARGIACRPRGRGTIQVRRAGAVAAWLQAVSDPDRTAGLARVAGAYARAWSGRRGVRLPPGARADRVVAVQELVRHCANPR